MGHDRHPLSPRLDHCPETLPAQAYFDQDWFRREQLTLWARNWVWAGRLNDLAPGTMQRRQIGVASVILCRTPEGEVSAFHNVCRHRGAELCSVDQQSMGKLVTCKYHAFAYAATDGRLVATGQAQPTADFDKRAHGLTKVSIMVWNGFVVLNLLPDPGPLRPDTGLGALDNWPMDSLVTGHRAVNEVAGNWKILWENYNECLHCATIHPELSDLVPIYKQGVMAQNEEPGWTPEADLRPAMKPGAASWTLSGKPCGPEFPGLTQAERAAGYLFVTLYPTAFIVAHVDYVRAVVFEPLGPERTRVTVEWYFAQETLDQPGFDAAEVAAFAKLVLAQDAEVVELNQRGLRSPAYTRGRLMPEEYAIRDFDAWVLQEMEDYK
ncbi:aromatic ring-hydroxylating dioxygenase subunit alpha [Tabrizicola sp.]|uniref:aromatic ring-hydroxylating oxygenase subunit alpha n=1 Tax=Tabrizicola sp. TaxID=2005166 RepID=UPI00286A6A3E|nr:aromatic ring-hydroxylating dioxygenase subunit alpha [Tabrizicola sp.]